MTVLLSLEINVMCFKVDYFHEDQNCINIDNYDVCFECILFTLQVNKHA